MSVQAGRPHTEAKRCRYCGRPGRFYRDEPSSYVEWHEWATRLARTHHQEQCADCGRYTVWKIGPAPPAIIPITQ